MEIVAKEIEGLDFFVVLIMNDKEESSIVEKVKTTISDWCTSAIDGEFGGNMHFVHSLDYNEERNIAYAFIDMGSMDPEKGFNVLSSMCDEINEKTGHKVINHIEIDGSIETLDFLQPE